MEISWGDDLKMVPICDKNLISSAAMAGIFNCEFDELLMRSENNI